MTITRTNYTIELTAVELHKAYLEEQQNLREEAFCGELEANSISYDTNAAFTKALSLYIALLEKDYDHAAAFQEAIKQLH